VAAFAAVVSYSHIFDLGRAHGQSGTAARLLPLSVDGLILAASLVLLHEARNQRQAPALARLMLALGVGATVAANVAYGLGYGVLGAAISAWPAVAFIGSVEMLMGLVRSGRANLSPAGERFVPAPGAPVPAALANGHAAPDGAPELARLYAADLARGDVPSIRRIRREVHVGQERAQSLQAYLTAIATERT